MPDHGIKEFVQSAMPFYKNLKPDGIDKMATKVFFIIDTNGLSFMLEYNLTLAGDVQRELTDSIQHTVLNGIVTDKGNDDMVPPLLVYTDLLATGDPGNLETTKIIYEQTIDRLIEDH